LVADHQIATRPPEEPRERVARVRPGVVGSEAPLDAADVPDRHRMLLREQVDLLAFDLFGVRLAAAGPVRGRVLAG
jgi:hypothetical protein